MRVIVIDYEKNNGTIHEIKNELETGDADSCVPPASVVWLVTSGSGAYGDEWDVVSIHFTESGAADAKKEYEKEKNYPAQIERWNVLR